jgi:hypothetical protein
MLQSLEALAFADTAISADGVAHGFAREGAVIDVLAPDGVGARADLRTTGAAITVEVSGGSFALSGSMTVEVQVDDCSGRAPRPNFHGPLS